MGRLNMDTDLPANGRRSSYTPQTQYSNNPLAVRLRKQFGHSIPEAIRGGVGHSAFRGFKMEFF